VAKKESPKIAVSWQSLEISKQKFAVTFTNSTHSSRASLAYIALTSEIKDYRFFLAGKLNLSAKFRFEIPKTARKFQWIIFLPHLIVELLVFVIVSVK